MFKESMKLIMVDQKNCKSNTRNNYNTPFMPLLAKPASNECSAKIRLLKILRFQICNLNYFISFLYIYSYHFFHYKDNCNHFDHFH